jgi:hypothetical protein
MGTTEEMKEEDSTDLSSSSEVHSDSDDCLMIAKKSDIDGDVHEQLRQEEEPSETDMQPAEEEEEEEVSVSIEILRQQLQSMRQQRDVSLKQNQMELKQLETTYKTKKKLLDQRLGPQQQRLLNQTLYMKFLKHEYYQLEKAKNNLTKEQAPSSTYILQQETPLLSTMHRSFLILPKQITVTRNHYETNIYPYLQNEIQKLQYDSNLMSQQLIDQVSTVAQQNTNLYDGYQQRINTQEREIREWKKQLQKVESPSKSVDNDDDLVNNEDLLSATEHSVSSTTTHNEEEEEDDDDDSQNDFSGKSPSRFVTVTKLWSPERLHDSFSHSLTNIRTAAAGRGFQLPFGN